MGLFTCGHRRPPDPDDFELALAKMEPPWDAARPSLFSFVRSAIDPATGRLGDGSCTLPDEEPHDGGIRFAAGALDGIMGAGGDTGQARSSARVIFGALRALSHTPDVRRARNLYAVLMEHGVLDVIDSVLERIVDGWPIRAELVRAIALWILQGSPDRGPVKFAVALLGVSGDDNDRDAVLTIGLHEEFTLYAVVALHHCCTQSEAAIWMLAQRVTGWGRVHAVKSLAETTDPAIRRWLLTDGCSNAVMPEYNAYTCAVAGELHRALERSEASNDGPLLEGASEILKALLEDHGPAEMIDQYPEGLRAVAAYLDRVRDAPPGLSIIETVAHIESFLTSPSTDWTQGHLVDWSESDKAHLIRQAGELLGRVDWRNIVVESLESESEFAFNQAAELAPRYGVDPWEKRFAALQKGRAQWYWLLETTDPERIDRILDYAGKKLVLARLEGAPSRAILPTGPEAAAHWAVDWIVSSLKRFPGKGWPFVVAAFRSPYSRSRCVAAGALGAWPRDTWPSEAGDVILAAYNAEVDENVREELQKLMAP